MINLQLYPSYWLTLSEMRRKMCYFVVFQPFKVEMLNCSYSAPQFWSIWPIFQMTPKLCYINFKKNSENLSRVGALGRRYPCYPNRAKIHRLGMGGQESNRQSLKSQEDKALFHQVKSHVFLRNRVQKAKSSNSTRYISIPSMDIRHSPCPE